MAADSFIRTYGQATMPIYPSLSTSLGEILPYVTEKAGGSALVGEAGLARGSGCVLRVTLLIMKIREFLGGIA